MEKLKVKYPVICEGKYDKIKLSSVIDAYIITTDGFGIFKSEEKRALLRKLCNDTKLIAVTDSDGAGGVIRGHLKSLLPPDSVINIYTPRVKGKEKRKNTPSAEGFLGVEGIDVQTLYELFLPYSGDSPIRRGNITKADLYVWGLSGGEGSAELRERLCESLELPPLSANALLEAVNLLYSREELLKIIDETRSRS